MALTQEEREQLVRSRAECVNMVRQIDEVLAEESSDAGVSEEAVTR